MTYASPDIQLESRVQMERDEWWWLGAILLFVAWAYSQYQLNNAINKCHSRGGVAKVSSYVFGTVWKVECFKR
jgi:hypothetical protein